MSMQACKQLIRMSNDIQAGKHGIENGVIDKGCSCCYDVGLLRFGLKFARLSFTGSVLSFLQWEMGNELTCY